MIDLRDIESLTAFKRNTHQYVKRLKKSRSPLVLTVNGKAELVVLDAKSYQDILAKLEYVETVKALKEGIESFEKGEGRPARKALEELRNKHGISR
ncbi:MAG: type II toxin-antitoxin system Phd/YefM family antitoxin [Acidobacteriota bacterium]|nr:type II toxin-antitoxin system Phd/YefM family antitoxin [Acidobacteriota bacterium]